MTETATDTYVETVTRQSRVIEMHTTLQLPDVAAPKPFTNFGAKEREALAQRRAEAAAVVVRGFAEYEAALGHPVTQDEQRRLRELLVLGQTVGVTGHRRVFGAPQAVLQPLAPVATAADLDAPKRGAKKTK